MSELKSAKKIIEELGFKKDSRESTQFAFLRHLKKAHSSLEESANIPKEPVQLEFNFEEIGPRSGSPDEKTKKVSNS